MLLEVKGLKTYFRDEGDITRAVDGITFTVDNDEIVALVGESGSGKTLTALSIMRMPPKGGNIETGEILFEGEDLLKLNKPAMLKIRGRKIGMVFQEPFTSLNPVMRIGDQIKEGLIVHKASLRGEADEDARELLRKVRIGDARKTFFDYPHQLSGGQRQRAMIAMALALNPSLLIADEPTTALDVTTQSEILKLILALKREFKMSVLFITHDLGVVNEVADRVIVMKDGKIVEQGKKEAVLRRPGHPYTRRLLNAVPRIGSNRDPVRVDEDIFVRVSSLSKSFSIERGARRRNAGVVKAVDGVDLTLNKGRTLGLVGESASGKTTLGKLILGLTEPDLGRIIIDNRDLKVFLKRMPGRVRQMMQIVFQDPYGSLDPRMTMGDIILEGPRISGVGRREKETILKEVLGRVRLEYSDIFKYPHQFSGGQRQRIAIARALAVKPKLLILDEPVSSLDLSIQADILALLRGLQQELGLTYLFISHDLRVVGSMSDEVAVMYRGRIVERGPTADIFTSPGHPYTKRLLASLPSL